VAEHPGLDFAALLRQLRAEAQLTQEELAEAAALSPRSVSDLERGIHNTARKETATLLAGALGLAGPARSLFVAAARGRAPAADVLSAVREGHHGATAAMATRTLPRDTASFTGRGRELARLLADVTPAAAGHVVGIHAIDGMAGIGKTTLAVRVAHELADKFPDGQFFLPLHAHTPGQRPADPADALASLLLTAGLGAQEIPPGLEARAARWRDHTAGKKILLVLDDAAGHEQVRSLLPGTPGSMVLITSRRRLAALDDAAQISLDTLAADDAATLLTRMAARPSLSSGDPAVLEITRLCGYLPLAIGMIASQLRNHPARTAAGLAAELSVARDRLSLMYAENLSVGAAFDLSYADLNSGQQRLFRLLGLAPGPSVDAYGAAALAGIPLAAARRHLDELYDQHLIAEPAPGRYELHDLLREHARTLVAADDRADGESAVVRLLDYYAHAGLAAGQHFTPWETAYRRPPPGPVPADVPDLAAFSPAAAWLEAERANVHAAVAYAAVRGHSEHAIAMAAAMSGFLIARGHWDQGAALQHRVLAAARQAGDRLAEADALCSLGGWQRETGNYLAAGESLTEAMAIYRAAGDVPGQANALSDRGFLQVLMGDYPAADASHRQALSLVRASGDRVAEAFGLQQLGLVQQLVGDYPAATASLQRARDLFTDASVRLGQAMALNCLSVVQQETGDYPSAAASQHEALAIFRDLGHLMFQAYALNDLGLVYQDTGDYPAAAASHDEALALFRDLGNRLGQAEALNRLGELATRTRATEQAQQLHGQALSIAREIGAVPEEARALEGLGSSYLQSADPDRGAEHFQLALVIYQRLGVPGARRVQAALEDLGASASLAD
jgi:tetratricopeptide (TPR) repeat protein/transcriptional regulator with XRE-family HTH domain